MLQFKHHVSGKESSNSCNVLSVEASATPSIFAGL
jgi:hypothetical protein